MALGVVCLICIFGPVIFQEFRYRVASKEMPVMVEHAGTTVSEKKEKMVPVDANFSILIPKIRANSRVVKDVDPYDSRIYQEALSRGVAHAKGSAYPGEKGNVFIFAHSSGNWNTAVMYNSVFYLLTKLEVDDEVGVMYSKKLYTYKVTEKKIADPKSTSYMSGFFSKDTLTLMTCYPPGTTLGRLLVIAKKI